MYNIEIDKAAKKGIAERNSNENGVEILRLLECLVETWIHFLWRTFHMYMTETDRSKHSFQKEVTCNYTKLSY